jgi:dTDP-glucose pyrophosphorylase
MTKRSLHIIMPMAGEGSRFLKEGYTTPKPLIMVDNKPLFMHAVDSIKLDNTTIKYSFIVRQEHIDKYNIDTQIKEYIPFANIFAVQQTTRGAVETCLIAESVIANDDAVIVMDCDLRFTSRQFNEIIEASLEQNHIGGAVVSFNSNLTKYSYAEIDDNGNVIRTAEKEVISNNALCGAYFFGTGKLFKTVAHKLLLEANFNKPEYYVSLLYNYILKMGKTVQLASLDDYYSYGTPEELKQYS